MGYPLSLSAPIYSAVTLQNEMLVWGEHTHTVHHAFTTPPQDHGSHMTYLHNTQSQPCELEEIAPHKLACPAPLRQITNNKSTHFSTFSIYITCAAIEYSDILSKISVTEIFLDQPLIFHVDLSCLGNITPKCKLLTSREGKTTNHCLVTVFQLTR